MNESEIMRMQEARPPRPAFDPYAPAPPARRRRQGGYVCLHGGRFVPDAGALAEVEEACGFRMVQASAPGAADFTRMVVEWYFSGDFRRVEPGAAAPETAPGES